MCHFDEGWVGVRWSGWFSCHAILRKKVNYAGDITMVVLGPITSPWNGRLSLWLKFCRFSIKSFIFVSVINYNYLNDFLLIDFYFRNI